MNELINAVIESPWQGVHYADNLGLDKSNVRRDLRKLVQKGALAGRLETDGSYRFGPNQEAYLTLSGLPATKRDGYQPSAAPANGAVDGHFRDITEPSSSNALVPAHGQPYRATGLPQYMPGDGRGAALGQFPTAAALTTWRPAWAQFADDPADVEGFLYDQLVWGGMREEVAGLKGENAELRQRLGASEQQRLADKQAADTALALSSARGLLMSLATPLARDEPRETPRRTMRAIALEKREREKAEADALAEDKYQQSLARYKRQFLEGDPENQLEAEPGTSTQPSKSTLPFFKQNPPPPAAASISSGARWSIGLPAWWG